MDNVKYLLASETDHLWGIVTKTVGQQQIQSQSSYPAGDHPRDYMFSPDTGRILAEFQILYITRGSGWFMSTHCPRTVVQAGDAIMLMPGEWHSYAPDRRTGWTENWIGFTGDFVQHLLRLNFFSTVHPILRVGFSDTLFAAFEQAVRVAREEKPAYQQQLAGFVALIVGTIYAKSRQHPYKDNPDTDSINLARRYMREHLSENINMEDVAREIGLGYSKFRKIFRGYTGFPPTQYFLNLKIEKAKDYLSSTSYSCKEIAFRLGFDSGSYFNKMFRQHTGITPLEFRTQLQDTPQKGLSEEE